MSKLNQGKVYITPEGAQKLKDELQQILRVTRPEVTAQVSAAAALGDRSENADYIYGKKRLRELDKRIRYLTKRIDNLEVVDRVPDNQDIVYFGAWVKLEDEQGEVTQVRIVGVDEIDSGQGWISLDSPLAKCLVGKQKGTDVVLRLPNGETDWHILDVRYSPSP